MTQKLPIRFALGVALTVIVFLLKPEWFSDGVLGLLLVLYLAFYAIITVFGLIVAVSDLIVKPEDRLVEGMPWVDLIASVMGLGVLLWIVYASQDPDMGNVIALAAALVGATMYGFSRWFAARGRQSAAYSVTGQL